MGAMSLTRIATYFGAVLLAAFALIVLLYGAYRTGPGLVAALALVLLIVAGSKLHGRRSRYAAIAARKRPAQDAHNRAADLAADARRATAEAAKHGERYCPLDPGDASHASHSHNHNHVSANGNGNSNGHAPTPAPSPHPGPPQNPA